MKTWKIAYTITEGAHEYSDDFTCELEADRLDADAVAALVTDRWARIYDFEPAERQRFLTALRSEGLAFLPDDSRAIGELGWEPVEPIVVTISDGLVESVSGVPEGMTLEVRDWDNGELDEQGEPVPTVRVWE